MSNDYAEHLPRKEMAHLPKKEQEHLPRRETEHLPRRSPMEMVALSDWSMRTVPLREVTHWTPLLMTLCSILSAEGRPMTITELTKQALERVSIVDTPIGPEGVVRLFARKFPGLTLIEPA